MCAAGNEIMKYFPTLPENFKKSLPLIKLNEKEKSCIRHRL